MKPVLSLILLLFTLHVNLASAQVYYSVYIPVKMQAADANAYGYSNTYTHGIVLAQQQEKTITRMLYDTAFNLLHKYETKDSISLIKYFDRPILVTDCSTKDGYFEIYASSGNYIIRQLRFESQQEETVANFTFKWSANREKLLAIIPGKHTITFLVFKMDENKLNYHQYNTQSKEAIVKSYILPGQTLTASEKKEKGKFLAIKYKNLLDPLYVSDLKNPKKYETSIADKLYYTDDLIYISLPLPWNTGYHILKLNRHNTDISFSNFFINKIDPSATGTTSEKVLRVAAYDSFLVFLSYNLHQFAYHFYNIENSKLLMHYEVPVKDSLGLLVHSPLIQRGTFADKDQGKDFDNKRGFIRRLKLADNFINLSQSPGDSLVITFGGFKETLGVDGLMLRTLTLGVSVFLLNPWGKAYIMPYLFTSRMKFLLAHSMFDKKNLVPSASANLTTPLNNFAEDKIIDDLSGKSSFIIELKNKLYVGIFDKKTEKYKISVY